MKIVVDLDSRTYERIRELVVSGEYESVEQFLRAGADNQLTIEEAEDESTQQVLTQHTTSSQAADGFSSASEQAVSKSQMDFTWDVSIPTDVPTREPHASNRDETLLFAQYYRFLPLKFVLWQLAVESADAGGALDLDEFRDYVAEAVIPVRDAIVAWEKEEDVSKRNKLSTAFPKQDVSDPERTMRRYLNHYVGHYRTQKEEPSGFGHDLGFVSIEAPTDESTTIELTPAGVAFTKLSNPVFSAGPRAAASSLSDEERNYLVTDLRSTLGLEYEFMEFIYTTLQHHQQTYTALLGNFRSFLEDTSQFDSDSSDNQIRSHTAGAISRMVSLGILERGSKRGVYETVRPPSDYRYHTQTSRNDATHTPTE